MSLWIGGAMLGIILLFVGVAPLVLPHDPQATSVDVLAAPSRSYVLGTDSVGRDVLVRLALGARSSILIAVVATGATLVLGALIGAICGTVGGVVDGMLMRLMDVLLSVPPLLTAIAVLAAVGPSVAALVGVMVLTATPQTVRLVRASAMGVAGRGFVDSARLSGIGSFGIIRRHILPNVRGVLVVQATITVAHLLLVETILSFLGLGVQPPTPSLGFMVAEGRQWMEVAPWVVTAPGGVIVFTVAAFTVLGQGLERRRA